MLDNYVADHVDGRGGEKAKYTRTEDGRHRHPSEEFLLVLRRGLVREAEDARFEIRTTIGRRASPANSTFFRSLVQLHLLCLFYLCFFV